MTTPRYETRGAPNRPGNPGDSKGEIHGAIHGEIERQRP